MTAVSIWWHLWIRGHEITTRYDIRSAGLIDYCECGKVWAR